MIYGIGSDLVQLSRIENAYRRFGDAFAWRILTIQEQEEWAKHRHKTRFLAKRFAAKEAFAKAVGTGLRGTVNWQAISVSHDEWGKPYFVYNDALHAWLLARKIDQVHLSLSDECDYILAFALAEYCALSQ